MELGTDSMGPVTPRDFCLVLGVALFVLGVTTTMRSATVVNITAIFEEKNFEDFEAVFYRTLNDFNNASQDIRWFGHAVAARRDLKGTISDVCKLMEGRRSSLHVLVVFGNVSTIQTINLLSQTLGIPMMGYMMDKADGYIQVRVLKCSYVVCLSLWEQRCICCSLRVLAVAILLALSPPIIRCWSASSNDGRGRNQG